MALGTRLSYNRRQFLVVVLLHRQHISILLHAITYTNRPLFGDSEAFNTRCCGGDGGAIFFFNGLFDVISSVSDINAFAFLIAFSASFVIESTSF